MENKHEEINERMRSIEQIKDSSEPIASTSNADTTEVIREIKDQESRRQNIILHNIPESNADDGSERVKHDKEQARELAKICKESWKKDDILSAIRLGKKQNDNKPRPLLIKMINEDKKKALFKNLKLLQTAPEKYRNVSVQNDLTTKQREEDKKLRDEAKKLENESSGNEKFKVRGPPWARRIVKTRN